MNVQRYGKFLKCATNIGDFYTSSIEKVDSEQKAVCIVSVFLKKSPFTFCEAHDSHYLCALICKSKEI